MKDAFLINALVLVLMLSAFCDAALAKKKDKPKPPSKPQFAPAVIAAQENFDRLFEEAAKAKQEVARRRTELSRTHKRNTISTAGSHSKMQKSAELQEAEKTLAEAKQTFEKVKADLVRVYDDAIYNGYLKQLQQINDQLEEENLLEKKDARKLIRLNGAIKMVRRKLAAHEKILFGPDEDYKKALEAFNRANRHFFVVRARDNRASRSMKGDKVANTEQLSAQDSIQEAIKAYSQLYKEQIEAKKVLDFEFARAAAIYSEFLRKEKERKKNEQLRNNNSNNYSVES